ncbi:MAG TPA: pyridoxamine 5'-phosphate oxidase family protein [Xanthobacteraceae bacterium]|nr:pyridoxamine 5'-phosphate oxidase family protein [Xanthobacteraceae bacterium]
MADGDQLDRVWDIIERVGVCMLTTHSMKGLRARPVEARPDRAAGLIWFLTDHASGKEHKIEAGHDIGLTFIDKAENAYLSLTAHAEVQRDHAKAAAIWKTTDNMWWSGPDDPNVRVLRVTPLTQSSGTDRPAKSWRRSNSSRRGSPANGPISARTARSQSRCDGKELPRGNATMRTHVVPATTHKPRQHIWAETTHMGRDK